MPQAGTEVFEAFKAVRLELSHLFIDFNGLVIAALLKHAFGDLTLHPARFFLTCCQLLLVNLLSLLAVELALKRESATQDC